MGRDEGELLIVFATQSGTAEEYAKKIARDARRRRLVYCFVNARHLEADRILCHKGPIIFVIATTGEGEMPSDMRTLWTLLLRRELPSNWLSSTRWAIYGLGDSSYEKYNYAAKKLYRRVEQLGATFLVERGDGDEQHPLGHDGTFLPWLRKLWSRLGHTAIIDEGAKLESGISIEYPSQIDNQLVEEIQGLHLPIKMKIEQNQRLTAKDHFQDVRHIIFRESSTALPEYKPGDVAVLLPINDATDVDELISALKWQSIANTPVIFVSTVPEVLLEAQLQERRPITPKTLLTYYLDIKKPPSRYFFELLTLFVSPDAVDSQLHREKLEELASAEAIDLYLDYVWRRRRTVTEVLLDFPSLSTIPLELIFDLFPPLRSREYSISSAAVCTPGEVHVTAALVQYSTGLPTAREGVCSQWLRSLSPGTEVYIAIRPGNWMIPPGYGPIVMMAAGTGIAPMRALIHHMAKVQPGRKLYLFFGCRYLAKDFLYADEWRQQSPQLTVHALGSRDDIGGSRQYLPALLRQHAPLLHSLLTRDDSSSYFLAGNSKLPKVVKAALVEISADPSLPETLIKSNRLFIESWS